MLHNLSNVKDSHNFKMEHNNKRPKHTICSPTVACPISNKKAMAMLVNVLSLEEEFFIHAKTLKEAHFDMQHLDDVFAILNMHPSLLSEPLKHVSYKPAKTVATYLIERYCPRLEDWGPAFRTIDPPFGTKFENFLKKHPLEASKASKK